MVGWNNPITLEYQFLGLSKVQLFLGGVYFWEMVSNLQHDWKLIRYPSRGSPWVKWTYIACRYLTLGSLLSIYAVYNVTAEVNCRALAKCVYIFSFFAPELASVLIGIRVIAIWNYNKLCILIVTLSLTAQTVAYLFELVKTDAVWFPTDKSCQVVNTSSSRPNVTATLVADFVLIVAMLIGLLRWRQTSRLALVQFLWNQGLIWLTLATVAEVPATTFIWLNLNPVMNLMFLTPEMLFTVIGATRMYRTLSKFTETRKPGGSHFTSWFLSANVGVTPDGGDAIRDRMPLHFAHPSRHYSSGIDTFLSITAPEMSVRRAPEQHPSSVPLN